ncbi:hypothetical protein N8693_01435 [Verrucomicrobia bacterium]|nr:hypothetical protein [Verrucomicrobiota bacterium]
MSDYSSNFPQQRPKLNLVFNSGSDKLDSRLSYSRSSSGTAFSAERHLSILNLLTNSEDFTAWSRASYVSVSSNAAASPNGTTTADKVTVSSTSNYPWVYQATGVTSGASDTVIFSVYLKMDGWRYVLLSPSNQGGEGVWFDLQSGTVGTEDAGSTGTITAIGSSGWYRCSVERTGSMTVQALVSLVDADNSQTGTAGGANGVLVWGGQLTDQFSGVTSYNATTTQISREFAPTLKSYSSDQPRFEYDPAADGQSAAGSPRGLLIESQSSNLIANSNDFSNGSIIDNLNIEAAAGIAPNGTLSASLLRATGSTSHRIRKTVNVTSGKTYSASVYVKASGYNYLFLSSGNTSIWAARAYFDLSNGTVGTVGFGTASIEDVGNGYFRCSITGSAASSSSLYLQLNVADADGSTSFTSNDYGGLLAFGLQFEEGAASSLITTSGAAASRASDSCSADLSNVGYTGGSVSVIAEANMPSDNVGSAVELSDGTSQNRASMNCRTDGSQALTVVNAGGTQAYIGNTTLRDGKRGMRIDNNNFGYVENGGTVITDTAGVVPVTDTLELGRAYNGNELNGYLKRVSLYSVALSDTELQALTS